MATINGDVRVEDGREFREVTYVSVGKWLTRESGTVTTQTKRADGRWQLASSGGIWLDPIVYGVLSSVDDRVARFDGQPLAVHPYCSGPIVWLACPSGGERPCVRCEEVDILLAEPSGSFGHGFDYGKRPVTCNDRCPTYPDSPDLARLARLVARVSPWRPRHALRAAPRLYRSLDDCQRRSD